MDDLVERLRHNPWASPTTDEAADRIEELEAEIERLKYLGYLIDRRTGVERRVVESYKARCGWYNTRQSQRRKENDDE
jgi:hypothetical protein